VLLHCISFYFLILLPLCCAVRFDTAHIERILYCIVDRPIKLKRTTLLPLQHFSARRHNMQRASSVCLSVTLVDQSKAVEVRIMQLSPQSSPKTLVSSWLTSPRNFKGNIGSGGGKKSSATNKMWCGRGAGVVWYARPLEKGARLETILFARY